MSWLLTASRFFLPRRTTSSAAAHRTSPSLLASASTRLGIARKIERVVQIDEAERIRRAPSRARVVMREHRAQFLDDARIVQRRSGERFRGAALDNFAIRAQTLKSAHREQASASAICGFSATSRIAANRTSGSASFRAIARAS